MEDNDISPEINEELITDLVNCIPDARSWLFTFGSPDFAVGYTLIFWPKFNVIDDYVLRHGTTRKNLLDFLEVTKGDSIATQAVMNHIHISDLHIKPINDAQA